MFLADIAGLRVGLQFGAEAGDLNQKVASWWVMAGPFADCVHEPEQSELGCGQSTPHILALTSAMNASISSGESGVAALGGRWSAGRSIAWRRDWG